MGIVILHSIEHFNFYSFPDTDGQSALLNFTDKAIWNSTFFIFGSKAYAVFALLFGFSFFIQDNNQRLRGNDFRGRFAWRLVLLFLIGQVNALFFTGEILVMYSLIGFILILTCRWPDRIVFWFAVILLLQPVEWGKFFIAMANPDAEPVAKLSTYYFRATAAVQGSGNFWQMARTNLWEGQMVSLTWSWENGRVFQTAALFLFGMLIGRRGMFYGTEENLQRWLKILLGALTCYFIITGLTGILPGWVENKAAWSILKRILQSFSNFSFMLVLLSGIILIFYRTGAGKSLMKIAPYGRMSLTNYLTQSMIGSLLFYHWGFGLHDDLGITASALVGVAIFLIQWMLCCWWLARHSHGPFEYLWKKATWIGKKPSRKNIGEK